MNEVAVFLAVYLIYLLLAGALAVGWYVHPGKRRFAFYILKVVTALTLVTIADFILNTLFPTARPFVSQGIQPLFTQEADSSFPSTHAAFGAVLATSVWLLRKDFGVAFFMAVILIGVGRVLTLVHYPIDILAGIIIGAGAAYLTFRFWPDRWA